MTRYSGFLLAAMVSGCSAPPPTPRANVLEPLDARVTIVDGVATLTTEAVVWGTADDVGLLGPNLDQLLVREIDGTEIVFGPASVLETVSGCSVSIPLRRLPKGRFVFLRGWLAVNGVFAGRYALPAVARVF